MNFSPYYLDVRHITMPYIKTYALLQCSGQLMFLPIVVSPAFVGEKVTCEFAPYTCIQEDVIW